MLYKLVERRKQEWLKSPDFPLHDIFDYIHKTGKLRKPQIEALETYLFLKIEGGNRPLPELLGEGFFTTDKDLDELDDLPISHNLRQLLKQDKAAMGLYQFARLNDLTDLQKEMQENHAEINFQDVINKLFYGISYTDYLMSLPMGAGKTFLIAAIIYLDLYFYHNEPNGNFARNFLVLIPNALKSSIGPSLKNIEKFDPTWILPEEVAHKIQTNIRIDVLDKKKESKNSMRTSNPNALKVMHATHDGFNHVFIVNAEKIILDNYDDNLQEIPKINSNGPKYDRANELRSSLSQLPQLGIFVDEVHHVHTSDHKEIKLRGVINKWNEEKANNISYMLGFSGTPYLPQTNSVQVSKRMTYKMKNITNTVYHYPLFDAIEGFLKRPEIKITAQLKRDEIIRRGVEDFIEKFGDKIYLDGSIAKLAIYCPSIEVLEEEVYPLLFTKLKIPAGEILRFHKGNNRYSLPAENETHFLSLDMPDSPHRFVLLVKVGREGWDCRSLTGVILSQEGDCSRNLVLQTCCRCLREMDKGDERALIWLNSKNAGYLEDQLNKEQDTGISEINKAQRIGSEVIGSTSRMKFLDLNQISYYKLQITYQDISEEKDTNTDKKLKQLLKDLKKGKYRGYATIQDTEIDKNSKLSRKAKEAAEVTHGDTAVFSHWLVKLSKDSFGLIATRQLLEYETLLKQIFTMITLPNGKSNDWNLSYELEEVYKLVRLSFHKKRNIKYNEIYDEVASDLLNDAKLKSIKRDTKHIYPSEEQTFNIIRYDNLAPRGTDIGPFIE